MPRLAAQVFACQNIGSSYLNESTIKGTKEIRLHYALHLCTLSYHGIYFHHHCIQSIYTVHDADVTVPKEKSENVSVIKHAGKKKN